MFSSTTNAMNIISTTSSSEFCSRNSIHIGQGSQGSISMPNSDSNIVIKRFFNHHGFKKERDAFTRLAAASSSSCWHPSLLRPIAINQKIGFGQIAFPYYAKRDLLEYIKSKPTIAEARAKILFRGIAQGLAHAHHMGIFHRDIKTDNVLVSDDENTLVLADWGLSETIQDWPPSGTSSSSSYSTSRSSRVFGYKLLNFQASPQANELLADVYNSFDGFKNDVSTCTAVCLFINYISSSSSSHHHHSFVLLPGLGHGLAVVFFDSGRAGGGGPGPHRLVLQADKEQEMGAVLAATHHLHARCGRLECGAERPGPVHAGRGRGQKAVDGPGVAAPMVPHPDAWRRCTCTCIGIGSSSRPAAGGNRRFHSHNSSSISWRRRTRCGRGGACCPCPYP